MKASGAGPSAQMVLEGCENLKPQSNEENEAQTNRWLEVFLYRFVVKALFAFDTY